MLSKISGRNDKDITPTQYRKILEDCFVFKGVNEYLYHALSFKGGVKRVDNKIIEYIINMMAHNNSRRRS